MVVVFPDPLGAIKPIVNSCLGSSGCGGSGCSQPFGTGTLIILHLLIIKIPIYYEEFLRPGNIVANIEGLLWETTEDLRGPSG